MFRACLLWLQGCLRLQILHQLHGVMTHWHWGGRTLWKRWTWLLGRASCWRDKKKIGYYLIIGTLQEREGQLVALDYALFVNRYSGVDFYVLFDLWIWATPCRLCFDAKCMRTWTKKYSPWFKMTSTCLSLMTFLDYVLIPHVDDESSWHILSCVNHFCDWIEWRTNEFTRFRPASRRSYLPGTHVLACTRHQAPGSTDTSKS